MGTPCATSVPPKWTRTKTKKVQLRLAVENPEVENLAGAKAAVKVVNLAAVKAAVAVLAAVKVAVRHLCRC